MTHQPAIKEALRLNHFEFDQDTINKFNLLIDLVLKWSQTINITAHRKPEDIIYKDIVDNLYLAKIINEIRPIVGADPCVCPAIIQPHRLPVEGAHMGAPLRGIDMGAGAGFSGIVLSIVNPSIQMAFLESDRKKINFIKEVYRQLEIHQMQCRGVLQYAPTYIHARAESKPPKYKETFVFSITRATWPLEKYLRHVHYYVHGDGYALYMSGKKPKNRSPRILKDQGFAGDKEFFYKIEPKGYERSIFAFKKIDF